VEYKTGYSRTSNLVPEPWW